MNPNNAIELTNVNLTFYLDVENTDKKGIFKKNKTKVANKVLDNINLEIKKGEIVGIVGTNGAGKSTLLSLMAKIQDPDSGTIETEGKIATILELGMGFHQDLTGRENIVLKGELYGFSKKQMESKIDEIIEYSGIKEYIDNPMRTYSSGMRSRLAFSIMIHVDADILLVDEILSTGDRAFSTKAADYFKKILKNGKTVVYVSHSPGSIESICTRAIWLNKGKIIADGKPKKVCALYNESASESLDIIIDQAKSGLADAQYKLAIFYKNGDKVEKNEEAYVHFLKLAAEQGHIKSQVELADLLMCEDEASKEEAIAYYQSAASMGDKTAKNRLSSIIGREDIREDYYALRKIFEAMAKRGNPSDMYRYANFLLKTAWNEEDRNESFEWFKKIADDFNHPDAIVQLAIMYRDGIGTKKDKQKYIETLEKGNSLDILKTVNLLADAYSAGTIIDEDQQEALRLYEKCAMMGYAPCQYITAMMYQEGKGTEPNLEKAEYWFNIYSKTEILSYKLSAINILKNNLINDSVSIQSLYNDLEKTYDAKVLLELCAHIREYPELYGERGSKLLEDNYEKLSKSYGKGMIAAYQYYSRNDSSGYSEEISKSIAKKCIYTGDSDILFKYAINSINTSEEQECALRCMKLSAQKGNKFAIQYCRDNNIPW